MHPNQLFDNPPKPRAKPRVMMHVIDAGETGCEDAGEYSVRFKCKKCGHETAWMIVSNVTEGKRGMACPECNKE